MFKGENEFSVGDRVKFKKSSLETGMIDAKEDDVFIIEHFQDKAKTLALLEGKFYNVEHLEHVKEQTMNNTEGQEIKWEGSQIGWEVGQVVWCLFAGKGRVISVDEGNFDPVQVEFDDGGYMTYGYDGGKRGYDFRCLFFSEPKIIADTMPPKKPFVPKLKEGDEVVTWFEDGSKYFIVVREETLTAVIDDNGDSFLKSETRFLKIGEEIKFES